MWWNGSRALFWWALVALAGVSLVTLGEWLMLYSPAGGYGATAGNTNFLYPSSERLQWGFFIAVLAAPVYVLVYHVIASALQLKKFWYSVMMALTVFGFSVGNVWLGTNAYLAYALQLSAAGAPLTEMVTWLETLSTPLLQVVRIAVGALSLITIIAIIRGGTQYPRIATLATPLFIIPLIFVSYFIVPTLGTILLPAALNFAHVFFMGITVIVLYEKSTTSK